MYPAGFAESNLVLDRPHEPGYDDVDALQVWKGQDGQSRSMVLSCWKPTAEELAEINRTGRVWLWIWGETMPPASLSGTNPFQAAEPAE